MFIVDTTDWLLDWTRTWLVLFWFGLIWLTGSWLFLAGRILRFRNTHHFCKNIHTNTWRGRQALTKFASRPANSLRCGVGHGLIYVLASLKLTNRSCLKNRPSQNNNFIFQLPTIHVQRRAVSLWEATKKNDIKSFLPTDLSENRMSNQLCLFSWSWFHLFPVISESPC